MENYNSYIGRLDYSKFIQFAKDKGKVHIYHKKDFFIEQNKVSDQVGWIETGAFRYVHTDKHGKEHVVEYSFANEFVCDYSSFIHQSTSLVHIQAMTECVVYLLSYQDIVAYLETDMETLRFGKQTVDALYEMMYKRYLELYCDSPEESYLKLMQRCPDLKEIAPLKEIASYLRVTPTTVSNIRRKITFQD